MKDGEKFQSQELDTLSSSKDELTSLRLEYQEFVNKVSHDLQAPIRNLNWYLQNIVKANKTHFDEKSNEDASAAFEMLHKLRSLVDDLVVYSRVSTANQKMTAVDSRMLCERVSSNLLYEMQELELDLSISALPHVRGNEKQIENLFLQLLKNAITFRDMEHKLEIQIDGELQNGVAVISVADNGVGIPEKHQETVFKMFAQPTGHSSSGNGAGLALAKRIVDLHKGKIWITSPNSLGGTTVHLSLPAVGRLS